MKRIILKAINFISTAVIVLSVFVLLNVVFTKPGQTPNVMGYSVFRVITGSMEPTIKTNSLIIVKDTQSIETGDVISFYSQDPDHRGLVNTHRVTDVKTVDGTTVYNTKGDANPIEDFYSVSGEDIIGKVVFYSYPLGVFMGVMSNPLVFITCIIIPLAALLIYSVIKTYLAAKEIAARQEEERVRAALERIKEKQEKENQSQKRD